MDVVLVHGSYHGAWCWDLFAPELEARGHRVVTPELPITDPAAGAAAYADVIESAMSGLEGPLLVAHSSAGLATPIVATRRPIERLVFIAGFLPQPGRSGNQQRSAEPIDARTPATTAEWTDLGDDVWAIGPNTARELFFHDLEPDLADWAIRRLRPQAYRLMTEVTPLEAWPDVASTFVVCRDDRAQNPDWGREAARSRLGVAALEIDGGHSPFLGRPAELADLLAL